MNMIPVNSDAVQSIGYQNGTLYVMYKRGVKAYEYPGVPAATYEALMAADSKGTFISANIRKQYPAR
jgi:hypothetical protein